MYSVHQHWDPLKVCIVGKSYSPEFYSFVKNSKVRSVLERIAYETEEDYQKLIALLESFGVKVLRPTVTNNYKDYLGVYDKKIRPPPMTPRDYSAMISSDFYWGYQDSTYSTIKGDQWPARQPDSFDEFPEFVKQDIIDMFGSDYHNKVKFYPDAYQDILTHIESQENRIIKDSINNVNSASTSRIGKDLYFGTPVDTVITEEKKIQLTHMYGQMFPDYRCHVIKTGGHGDGVYCPVKPGLIVSLKDIETYKDTFPDWEVVYLPDQSWDLVKPFMDVKTKNHGKWWVPGEELNDDFTNFVEEWLDHWVGYVEETVFDVNMLVIDEKNVVCNNYNKQVFDAFDRHGITPHIVNFRHRYFWDGGLHCITSDVHREGTLKDYFPDRG